MKDAIRTALQAHMTEDPTLLGDTHAASAAHAIVWRDGEVVFDEALGWAALLPERRVMPATPVFDLASVTKIVSPTTLAMQAVTEGLLRWDTPIAEHLEPWRASDPEGTVHLLHLLNHSSGLPAWHQYYLELPLTLEPTAWLAQEREIRERIAHTPRKAQPGTHYEYSDLGYITLCWLLEEVLGSGAHTYAQIARRRIFEPLGMRDTRYVDLAAGDAPIRDAVATELCGFRGRVSVGTVHDENTMCLGGVSGHAGVFSTAQDMLTFGRHMLAIDHDAPTDVAPIVGRDALKFCWSEAARGADGHHLGGWDTPSGARTSAGRGFGRQTTVGHLGFTGTSLWIEREQNLIAVLLTNRVHPTRENPRILDMRIAFHEAIFGI